MASLPKLAYVYDPLSFGPLSIAQAAEGICRLVWVVDYSKPEAASTARLLRKFGPVIDSSDGDVARVAAALREHEPDGVLSMHDSDLVWTAELAELLQLPFHSRDAALKLTDKSAQRDALALAGLAVPMYRIIDQNADAATIAEIASAFTYPAVLKPRFGQASRDTAADFVRPGAPSDARAAASAARLAIGGLRARGVRAGRQHGSRWELVSPALSQWRAWWRTAMSSTRQSVPVRHSVGRSGRPVTARPARFPPSSRPKCSESPERPRTPSG